MRKIDLDLLPQALPEGWVPGEGLHLGGMIIGEAPGRTEWDQKRPFVGDSGQFLRKELSAAGLDLDDMYVTNVVKIWPRTVTGATRPPNDQEVEGAMTYLVEEIQHIVPKYILALGATAYHALTGSELGIGLYRGIWSRLDERFDWDEALVLPTYHPAYVQRTPDALRIWRRDLTEFATTWLKGAPSD